MDVIGIHERRIQRVIDSIGNTFFSGCATDIHDRHAAFLKRIAHVGKIGIDISRYGDDLRNRTGGIGYHVIRFGESVKQVQLRIDLFQFLVIDDKQRIHMFGQTSHTGHRFLYFLLSFESKRNRDNTYGQNPHFLGYLGDHRRSACTCTATHSGSDKQHLSAIIERFADMLTAFFGILTGGLGISSGTQTRT